MIFVYRSEYAGADSGHRRSLDGRRPGGTKLRVSSWAGKRASGTTNMPDMTRQDDVHVTGDMRIA